MPITYDKESGALYLKLRDGSYSHTENVSNMADVYMDLNTEGRFRGAPGTLQRVLF